MIFLANKHVLAVTLGWAMGLSACTQQHQSTQIVDSGLQAASHIATSPTTEKTTQTHIQVVVSWEDLNTETMASPETGRLVQILVQEGQHVQAGQRLAQIKPAAQTSTRQVQTQTVNQAAKQQAYQKWQQDKALYAQGFISQAALDKSAAAYRLASQSQTSTQTVAAPTTNAPPVWLQAPFNGVIEPFTVLSGNEVKNGQKLFSIKPLHAKRIKILVSQDNVHELFVGQRLFLQHNEHILNLQISELPAIDNKQYVLAYAIWPQDVPKPPDLSNSQAYLILETAPRH